MPKIRTVNDATLEDLEMVGSWMCGDDRLELALTRDPDDYVSLAEDAFASPIHKVVLDDGVPIFAFGATPMGHGMAQVWGFKTERGKCAIGTVTKYIKRTMIPDLRAMGVRRAACMVHPKNTSSQRWLAFLGFVPKATIPGFGSRSEEMILYQRDEPDAGPA